MDRKGIKEKVEKAKGGSPTKVISNLGNEIDITPSDNHTIVFKNPGPTGNSNSSVDILDEAGNIITRRWYDSNGLKFEGYIDELTAEITNFYPILE